VKLKAYLGVAVFFVTALPSQAEISGEPLRSPPARHFVCDKGYTLKRCDEELVVLKKALAKYPIPELGEWTWVLVRSEYWRLTLLTQTLDPGIPALTDTVARATFFDDALVTGASGRMSELMAIWHMGRESLIDFSIRHELGHAFCNDVNEMDADRVARLLEQKKPISCKSKVRANRHQRPLKSISGDNDWMSKKMTRTVAAAAPQSASSISVATLPSVKLTTQDWRPQIILRVHNYAHVNPGILLGAENIATLILKEAKVDAQWVDCPISKQEADRYPDCLADLVTDAFMLNIPTPMLAGKIPTHDDTLGYALTPCDDIATFCMIYVMFSRVSELAARFNILPPRLLGHVLAHEVGHMLGVDHSSNGIMRGEWSRNDLKLIGFSTLYFSTDQAAQLRARLLRRAAQQEVAQNLKSVPSR